METVVITVRRDTHSETLVLRDTKSSGPVNRATVAALIAEVSTRLLEVGPRDEPFTEVSISIHAGTPLEEPDDERKRPERREDWKRPGTPLGA